MKLQINGDLSLLRGAAEFIERKHFRGTIFFLLTLRTNPNESYNPSTNQRPRCKYSGSADTMIPFLGSAAFYINKCPI